MTDVPSPDLFDPPEPPEPPDPGPVTERSRVACPACGAAAFASEGWTLCGSCSARFRMMTFAPLLDAPELLVGTGRCANHPGKDAASACARCGAFACDVCVTRTGEDVLCPECFSLLHDRGQLTTTQASRTRWDYVTLGMSLVSFGFACFPAPITLALSIWLLLRARRDRWIRRSYVFLALVISLLQLGYYAVMLVGAFL